jgi:hypothetical protein
MALVHDYPPDMPSVQPHVRHPGTQALVFF